MSNNNCRLIEYDDQIFFEYNRKVNISEVLNELAENHSTFDDVANEFNMTDEELSDLLRLVASKLCNVKK